MKLYKIKSRKPELDTELCYCINNKLWLKTKTQIINNNEFLAPKNYNPSKVANNYPIKRLIDNEHRFVHPLKMIMKEDRQRRERIYQKVTAPRKKPHEKSDRIYKFAVNVNYHEYEALWNFLYREVRNPFEETRKINTIEETIALAEYKKQKRQQEKENE